MRYLPSWFLCCFIAGLWFHVPSYATAWQEITTTHFRILYQTAATHEAEQFLESVSTYAEHYYQHIALGLGISRVAKADWRPWLGAHRCTIYLYADKHAYVESTGAPPWSAGLANTVQRTVWSFFGSETFLNAILPHELAHIIFREYVGIYNPRVPRWLDEGVADYAAIGRLENALARMPQVLQLGMELPLETLTQLRMEHAANDAVQVFYLQAATLVHFLLDTYGTASFLRLCDALRDGATIENALRQATHGELRTLGDLEEAWRRTLLK